MFCLNIRRPELAGFVAREKDDAPCLLRIAFKHMALSRVLGKLSGSTWRPCSSDLPCPSVNGAIDVPTATLFISQVWRAIISYQRHLLVVSRQVIATSCRGRLAAFSAAILSVISFIIPTRHATKVNCL